MKIGIITCHDVYNFGSSLQAYALCKYLNDKGFESEIIDYKPDYLYRLIDFMEVDSPKWKRNVLTRWIYRMYTLPVKLRWLVKYYNFKKFNHMHFQLSSCRFNKIVEFDSNLCYDIYICGSDQIWNSKKYLCGEDPVFYLSFTDKKKIAYAASFGGTAISEIGAHNVQKYLPLFSNISVREKSGLEILNKYNIIGEHVLDPVFLLNSSEWKKLVKRPKKLPEKYILVYGYDNSSELNDAVNYYLLKNKCEVISYDNTSYLQNAGPQEFLAMVENATMVITSSFHAIAFSIILHTPFVATMTSNCSLFERLDNLLDISGLEERKYSVLREKDNWENIEIDFSKVDKKLEAMINKSKEFLASALIG